MKSKVLLTTLLIVAALVGCQPVPGGGGAASDAPSVAPPSANQPQASATPYTAPGY